LKANGDAIVKSKASTSGASEYEAIATFSIEDGKIVVVTSNGPQKITETYDYVDGEIHMTDVVIGDISFSIKFRRAE
jgi:hypothetical protein